MIDLPGKAGTSWIPSSLAGKALDVFSGGAEQRKLRTICSVFPHNDNTNNANIWDVYGDAFGYLSPGAQSSKYARNTINKLFLAQIRLGQWLHLAKALQSLPRLDIQYILSAIMNTCMNDNEKLYDVRYQQYRDTASATTTNEAKLLVPVLCFITGIATQSDSACRTALDAGILDMLLRIYVLFPSFSRSSIDAPEHWSPLLQACRSTILALSQSQTNYNNVLRHPVCAVWTDCHPHPPSYSVEPPTPHNSIPTRCRGWRQATKQCVKRRIMAIIIDSQWRSNVYEIEDIEACADIIEFTQPQFYDSEIVDLAFLAGLKLILLNGDSAGHLISALGACTLEDVVRISSSIIRLWLECIQVQIQNEMAYGVSSHHRIIKGLDGRLLPDTPIDVDEDFHDREKARLFQRVSNVDTALYNIILFATDAVQKSPTIRCGMLNAGALSLVIVAFANSDFRPSSLLTPTKRGKQKGAGVGQIAAIDVNFHAPSPIPLDVIEAEASTLSVLMHDAAFRESWRDKQLYTRRRLCSSFINVLLGDFGKRDDRYAWTRALFRKILA